MVEHDEAPGTNAYFMPKESQIKNIEADIIFDTPFLYMIVSRSETGRLFVVSIGRFTNIQEINPPENMHNIDIPIITIDDNDNRNINDHINRNIFPDRVEIWAVWFVWFRTNFDKLLAENELKVVVGQISWLSQLVW
ncbi:hypothetical protein DINM_000105 [Dirofilaria immitis]|nr:hypothetical protein [Dirofilaria immitis]